MNPYILGSNLGDRIIFLIFFFMFFFLSLLLQCEFNITVSTQILLPLMMPRPPAPAALFINQAVDVESTMMYRKVKFQG